MSQVGENLKSEEHCGAYFNCPDFASLTAADLLGPLRGG
jgi:hypothetical protein